MQHQELRPQQKTLHQTFEIEEVERLTFDLFGEIEVEKWEGNTVLTETNIELHDATKGIFNHYLKEGRYEIVLADSPNSNGTASTGGYALNEDYFNDDETTPSTEVEEAPIEPEEIAAPEVGGAYLTVKEGDRKPIRTRDGECLEIIKIRVFIPLDFNQSGDNSYFRTLPDEDED